MSRRRRQLLGLTAATLLLTSCGDSVVTSSGGTDDKAAAVSTTRPVGSPDQLLPRLVTTLRAVSEAIIDDADQVALFADAEALWAAARPEVAASDADIATEMDGMMDLARRAVERRRPADADKAAKYLGDLVDHHLGR